MTRFSLGRDEDGNEEGPSNNNRPLPKRPRILGTIDFRVITANISASPAANSGGRAAASNTRTPASAAGTPTPRPPSQREPQQVETPTVDEPEDQSEEESDSASDSASDESEEEESGGEGEGEEEEEIHGGANSTPNGNSTTVRETGRPSAIAPTPVSVTLIDPDVFDCPICLEPLCSPVYQCENGHVACAACCTKMRNKCASCSWPIGYNRCRALEKVLESVRISCRNMQHGCTESLNYSKKHDHEKTCNYAPCSCPHLGCTFVSLSKCLYKHFSANHSRSCRQFSFDIPFTISLDKDQKHAFFQEKNESLLFVLNRSNEFVGSFVNVICIAPTSSMKASLYDLTAHDGLSLIRLRNVAENTPKWTAQPPARKFVIVPNEFTTSCGQLKLEVTIWRDNALHVL